VIPVVIARLAKQKKTALFCVCFPGAKMAEYKQQE